MVSEGFPTKRGASMFGTLSLTYNARVRASYGGITYYHRQARLLGSTIT